MQKIRRQKKQGSIFLRVGNSDNLAHTPTAPKQQSNSDETPEQSNSTKTPTCLTRDLQTGQRHHLLHETPQKGSNLYHLSLTPQRSDEIVEEGETAVLGPAMSLAENDKREVCPLHGWVGRRAFQQERHDLCDAPEGSTTDAFTSDEDPDGSSHEDEDEDEGEDEDSSATDESLTEEEDGSAEEILAEEAAPSGRSSARRCGIPPKKTLAVRRITRHELATGRAELKALGADVPYERPRIREDCAKVPRPCPYVACKYSLYLDVSPTGSIILNFPHLEPGQMPPERSCSLDLAEKGPLTLEYIAVVTNLTRERIRQVELKALNLTGERIRQVERNALMRRERPGQITPNPRAEDPTTPDEKRRQHPKKT